MQIWPIMEILETHVPTLLDQSGQIWHARVDLWSLEQFGRYNFQPLKIQEGGRPPSWKLENRPYPHNGLIDLHKIRQSDGYWASNRLTIKILNFLKKSKMVDCCHPENLKKWPYLRNGLTNQCKIWQDAQWPSVAGRQVKFPTFKNPRWRTVAIFNNQKSAISAQLFDR